MTHSVPAEELHAFAATITSTLGLQVNEGKLAELDAILASRLDARRMSYSEYEAELRSTPNGEELGVLASLLTVSETFFFRHEQQLVAGIDQLVRWARHRNLPTLRVASFGCASGEEPYSLAMLLHERLPEGHAYFEVTGVDVNPIALERARRGEYGQWSLRATPAPVVARWFQRSGGTFRLDPKLKERVRFRSGNLVHACDPAEVAAYHGIFCRNVLMYFSREQYAGAVRALGKRLVSGGFLFLGHAETLRGLATSFDLVSDAGAFYYRLSNSAGATPVDEAPFEGVSGSGSEGWVTARPHEMANSWMDAIAESTARVQALSVPSVVSEPSVSEAPLALFREERFAQALAALRALPSDTARDPELSLLEAVLLFHQNECDASEQICRELLLHRELTASAHYLLALCSEARTRFDTAALHDQAAIEFDPSFSLPRLHLGRMLRRLGATERAAHELTSARQLLEREDAARLTLFGAGLGRSSLLAFCDAELVHARREGGT